MAASIRHSPTAFRRWLFGPLVAAALVGCAADEFPTCCEATGIRDVPYTRTYRFNYRTGSFDIAAPNTDRILGILTQADVLTLMNAASVTQTADKGLISGLLRGPRGPLREAALVVRDAEGNVVSITDGPFRNFFYNSLGRVPDFLISEGTSDQGSFTMFNAPPGELFLQLVGGGRGNGRITSYRSSVSIGRYNVLEVFPPKAGLLGVVVDAFSTANVPNATVAFAGWDDGTGSNAIGTDAGGLFLILQAEGVPTQAESMVRLSSPNYRPTYYRFDTPISRVISRQQAFDPLTLDNLLMYSESGLQAWAQRVGLNIADSAGIILGRVVTPDRTGVSRAVVTPADRNGQPLADQGIRVHYSTNAASVADQLDPTLAGTTDNPRYVLFIPDCNAIAGGTVYLNAVAQTVFLPPVMEVGRASAPCMPGGVFVQDIVMQDFPKAISTYYTTSFQGRVVTADNEPQPVGHARLDIQGVGTGPYMTDENGAFFIPRSPSEGAVEPLLAFSPYTVRISVRTSADADSPMDPDYVPTYLNFVTGLNGGQQDLVVLTQDIQEAACGENVSGDDGLRIFGLVRDLGAADRSRRGLPVEGVSVQVVDAAGNQAPGRVVYQGSTNGTKTGLSGLFAVCGLPAAPAGLFPAVYQLRVVSEDDSGAALAEVFGDGITFVNMVVNKALPRTIPTTGRLTQLLGSDGDGAVPVGNATLSVLGDTMRFSTVENGAFNEAVSLGSNGTYIVRASKDGYLQTYNYHVSTPTRLRQNDEVLALPDLVITSQADLDRVGIPLTAGSGIVAGTVITPGFRPPGITPLVSGLAGTPILLIAGFFDRNDLYPDVMAVFSDKAQVWYGDGAGTLFGPSEAIIRDSAGNAVSISAVAPADFNLDGNVDLAVIGGQRLYVVYGRSDGTFEAAQELALPTSDTTPFRLMVLDLDADGDQDLVTATNGANPIVRFINKTGISFAVNSGDPVGDSCASGQPTAMGVEVIPGAGPNAMLIADQDGSLCLYPFNSNGNPLAMRLLTLPAPAVWMETGFLDLDAISDMVIVHQSGVSVLIGVANQIEPPPFIEVAFPEGFSPWTALMGDLTRDFRDDLLVSGSTGVLSFAGAGNGRFNDATTLSGSTSTREIAAVDLDGDGRLDLIADQSDGNLVRFPGANLSGANVRVEARNETGASVGQVYYLDQQGAVDQTAVATGPSGRFLISDVPPGFTMARVAGGGSGNALVTVYPSSVSYAEINVNPVPGTITVTGQTIDPIVTETAGVVAEGIRIVPLGTGTEVRSSSGGGPADPTTGAFELTLDANSEYVLKLEP